MENKFPINPIIVSTCSPYFGLIMQTGCSGGHTPSLKKEKEEEEEEELQHMLQKYLV